METGNQPKVFISHSSADKEFVRKLVEDLRNRHLNVWFDEASIRPGDTIVAKISEGLRGADYVIVVLSKASIQSGWVNAEINSALMEQLSKRGGFVIPVLIDNTEIPILMSDRKYADFRKDYTYGLNDLLRVFTQESETPASLSPVLNFSSPKNQCISKLSEMSLADLRRLITKKFSRSEVGIIWFDMFETRMDDDMLSKKLAECVVELISLAKEQDRLDSLVRIMCEERPDVARP